MIFPEALETAEEFRDYAAAVDAPLLANMTEFGRSPALTAASSASSATGSSSSPCRPRASPPSTSAPSTATCSSDGSAQPWLDRMQTRDELYDLLDYDAYADLDAGVARPAKDEDEDEEDGT